MSNNADTEMFFAGNKVETAEKLPTVAIVGRPNVGKSSLFNAILGRRLSIVHEMSGVTRDRVIAPVQKNGRKFLLVDTGGLGMMSGETRKVDMWDKNIAAQVDAAIESADILIFMGDAQAGVTPLDSDVATRLRASGLPVFVCANKCDNGAWKDDAAEFASLGFGEVYPVSCLHRGGINALLEDVLKKLPPKRAIEKETQANRLRIAIVGRPNVGKSSLVNALIGDNRVMTSPIAGTTRDAIDVDFSIMYKGEMHPAVLVDTAGMRKTGKREGIVEYFSVMRAQSAIERADLIVMVLEASEYGATAQDKKIAGMIESANKSCVIAVNKCDLLEDSKKRKTVLEEIRRTMPKLAAYAPVEWISAEKKLNLDSLLDRMTEVMEQLDVVIPTGVLNRLLADIFEKHTPPLIGTAPLKLYYANMTGSRPARVRLFVNRTELAADNYIVFLRKKLREAFGMIGTPLVIELKARPKKVESVRRNENRERSRGSKRRNG